MNFISQDNTNRRMSSLYREPQGIARVAVVGIVAGIAICLFAGIFTWMVAKPGFTVSDELDVALKQLKNGDSDTAVAIANKYKPGQLKNDADIAKQQLIFGVDAWERSERAFEQKFVVQRATEALEHLEKAKSLGFPESYEGLGQYALGMTLAKLRNSREALEPLRESTLRWPMGRNQAIETMIEVLLSQTPPDIERSREELEHWKTLNLDEEDRYETVLANAKLLLAEGKSAEAYEQASTIPPQNRAHARARLLMADILLGQAANLPKDKRTEKLETALDILNRISKSLDITVGEHRETNYLTGVVLRRLGRVAVAERVFFGVRQGFPESPEAMASAVEEIEVVIEQDRPDEATEIVAYVNNHYGKPEWYVSRRFRLEDHRNRLVAAGRALIQAKYYDAAVAFGKALPIVCTDSDRARVQAEAYQSQARSIDEQARQATGKSEKIDRSIAEKALEPWGKAGAQFEKLSNLELVSPEYAELLWTAIDCHQRARHWDKCQALLERYLDVEDRAKRPRALLAQSDVYLATDRTDKALLTLRQLIANYADDPLVFRARILLSRALDEKQNFDEAASLLLQNLNDGSLTPESLLWKDSLYQLGSLHYRRGSLIQTEVRAMENQKAGLNERLVKLAQSDEELKNSIRRNEFAIKKYEDDPRNFHVQYMIAEAHRMRAALPQTILNEDRLLADEKRRQLVVQRREHYESAIATYAKLRDQINAREDALQLDPSLSSIFRICYFGIADLHFELQDYEKALPAYNITVRRYLNEPEALEAMVQIIRCHELMGNKEQARITLNNAIQTLQRIPVEKDSKFRQVTSRDRAGWDKYLTWLQKNA